MSDKHEAETWTGEFDSALEREVTMTAPDLSQRLKSLADSYDEDDGSGDHIRRLALTQAADEIDAQSLALEEAQRQLAHWKICENCGEALSGPGICDHAISEREKGLELMHEETLTRAEAADTQRAEARQQIASLQKDIATERGLTSTMFGRMVAEGLRADSAESSLAVLREALTTKMKYFKEIRSTSLTAMRKAEATLDYNDAYQRRGEWGTLNVVIAELAALLQGEPEPK